MANIAERIIVTGENEVAGGLQNCKKDLPIRSGEPGIERGLVSAKRMTWRGIAALSSRSDSRPSYIMAVPMLLYPEPWSRFAGYVCVSEQ
jgi:hypothetical protein